LHPVGGIHADKVIHIPEFGAPPEQNFNGRVGVVAEQGFVKKESDELLQTSVAPIELGDVRGYHDKNERSCADTILREPRDGILDYQFEIDLFHNPSFKEF
jgi:hypothetical protein